MTKSNAMSAAMLVAMALICAIVFAAFMLIKSASGEERATFTDKNGHFAGSSITRGAKTDFYDGRGFYQGSTTRQGTPSNPLGGVDGSKPFGSNRR